MKKVILYLLAPFFCLSACKDKVNDYEIIHSELRAPAYPLVTIDPYTSAWSMTDNLYDSNVKHWTGKDFPLIGVIKVDGVAYRFMGVEDLELTSLIPTSEQGEWYGQYTTNQPPSNWKDKDFDDIEWKKGKGAFGTMINEPTAKTDWTTDKIWVRRKINLDENLQGEQVYLEYSNDDDAIIYINGLEVVNTGATCNKNTMVKVPDHIVNTLNRGENLITAHCINPVANGLLDFGLLIQKKSHTTFEKTADQKNVDVQAMQTHYLFTCGNVDLKLTFSAPLFMDNLKLLSRPINYITYQVTSNDGKQHDVQLYFEASPHWALNQPYQEVTCENIEDKGLLFLKAGSKEQQILAKQGDDLRIDWGFFYLATENNNVTCSIDKSEIVRTDFINNTNRGKVLEEVNENPKMSLTYKLGYVKKTSGKLMVGYDDIYSIQYFGENLRPYWNATGDQTIIEEFHSAYKEYDYLIEKCYLFDKVLMNKTTQKGGKEYAELCALAYRQAISAHKLVKAPNGDLLFLSKENNSNGSIGTVDVTYPSAPLFLYYNPELVKGLLNHIFYFSESGKWTKPFPSHDIGTYPLANGQTYGGDMPIEEAGNMLILTAAVCTMDGDASYAEKHWDALTIWTDYLVGYGLDPGNQLCTDDFAGHFAHNANLSIKAIMGIASYSILAGMLEKKDVAEEYGIKAKDMAKEWMEMADDGDHYRLTFDKPGTWSQKYNLVWNKLLKMNVFPDSVAQKEIIFYLNKQNKYGLPLDSRETYTKSDWIMWTATLADNKATFENFIKPLYMFVNETTDRVPMSDWIYTDKPHHRGFKARSVVGGYYIKMLEDKLNDK